MFNKDPRENVVSLKHHATWEADNRVEEMWQWGAQVLDLCDLPPEEYKNSTAVTVKTIQNCGECGGGGSSVEKNTGMGSINSNGRFVLSFTSPVASPIYAFVTVKDAQDNSYTFRVVIGKGGTSASYDLSQISTATPFLIDSIRLSFEDDVTTAEDSIKDKKYEYSATFHGDVAGKTFALSILCTETDNLTAEDYLDIIRTKGDGFDFVASYDEFKFDGATNADAHFFAPCSFVDEWMPENVEQEYFREHSFDFVILTESVITEIKEDFAVDTENWSQEAIVLNGRSFNKWLRRDLSGSQCPYSIGDDTCEDYDLTYSLKIKED